MGLSLEEVIAAFGSSSGPVPSSRLETSVSLNTQNGVTGPLTAKLSNLFNVSQRKALRKSLITSNNHNAQAQWRRLLGELEKETRTLLDMFFSQVHLVSEALLAVLGGIRGGGGDDEGFLKQRRRFFSASLTNDTKKVYARSIAQALCLLLKLLDSNLRARCNVEFDENTLNLLYAFHNSAKGVDDIQRLVLSFLSQDRGMGAVYHREPLCIPAIASFVSGTNNFTGAEIAQKTISSLKYLCRGCVMLDAMRHPENIKPSEITSVNNINYSIGDTSAFSCLDRLHKGICSIERVVMKRVVLQDGNRIFVDGVDLSPSLLSSSVKNCYHKSQAIYRELLMGFAVPEIAQAAYNAFGESQEYADGYNDLLTYVLGDRRLARRFFTAGERLKVKKIEAKKFLGKCESFERLVLPMMHLLMGGTSRATDYLQLTFRVDAGGDFPARVFILNEDLILVVRQSRKTAFLEQGAKICPAVIPRVWFDHILTYWMLIRPFCAVIAKGIDRRDEEVTRWRRYCFVRGGEKQVRRYVEKQIRVFSAGAKFQRLRHGAEAIFRNYIVPKEIDLNAHYSFDKLFGHTYKTGLSYGVLDLIGSDTAHDISDISSTTRCLKAWWALLALGDPMDSIPLEDPLDSSDSSGDDDSISEINESPEDEVERGDNDNDDYISEGENDLVVDTRTEIEALPVSSPSTSSFLGNSSTAEIELSNESITDIDFNQDDDGAIDSIATVSYIQSANESFDASVIVHDSVADDEVIEAVSAAEISSPLMADQTDVQSEDLAVADSAMRAIQRLGYSSFRSSAQHSLVSHILHGESSIAGILPTGGGKTLTILVAVAEEIPGITLVIYPLRSVYDDAIFRLNDFTQQNPRYRAAWGTYQPNVPIQTLAAQKRVLLLTAEEARDATFLSLLKSAPMLVKRVIFEEAPVFVTSHFRLGISSLPMLLRSYLTCPFVLLTGTVKVDDEQRLRDDFYSPGLIFVRGPTVRPEIQHIVVRLPGRNVSAHDVVKYIEFKANENTIVFVRSMKKLEEIATGLEAHSKTRALVVRYYGSLPNDEREEAARSWKQGKTPIMVATTAFGFGIHDMKCHTTIHVDGAFDVESYVQGAGRGGRDGKASKSIVLLSLKSVQETSDISRLFASKRCRMAAISSLLDPEDLCWTGCCGKCDWCIETRQPGQIVSEEWRSQSLQISNPLETSTLTHERSQASFAIAHIKRDAKRLIKACEKKICFSCLVMSRGQKKPSHSLTACPHWKRRCFRCGSDNCGRSFGSTRTSCPDYATISEILKAYNVCVTCALPPYILDEAIHNGQTSMGRGCRFRDSVLPTMLLLWHCREGREALNRFNSERPVTLEAYLSWALDATKGIGNFLRFLSQYCS